MSENRRAFLTAEWQYLVMLNFEIDPTILERMVPKGTEIDFWNGRTFVSIVGFRFLNTKLLGWPIPFHQNFSEVNLRFYVRRKSGNEWRRGVAFIKEIVPLPAVTFVARTVYNENYVTLPMKHRIQLPSTTKGEQGSIAYSWKWEGQWAALEAELSGEPQSISTGSEEEFITEHFWGYATQRNGSTMEYGVEHPAWRVWPTTFRRLECNFTSLYGAEFAEVLSRPPNSAFIAEGSAVVVRKGTRLS